MKDELKNRISQDLKIAKFSNETTMEFNQRLIYSALCMWVKSLIKGNSVNDFGNNVDETFPDIMYVQMNLAKVAEAYLECFECNYDWFDVENDTDNSIIAGKIAGVVIQDMIRFYEIGEVYGRKLSPVTKKTVAYGELIRKFGYSRCGNMDVVIGGSIWSKENDAEENYEEIIPLGGKEYYKYLEEKLNWTVEKIVGNYELFKVGTVRAYSKAWIPFDINKLKEGISLVKNANTFEPGYFLLSKNVSAIRIVRLDPWYRETNEIYRIMYALNAMNESPAQFRTKEYDDYVVLRYASALPENLNKIVLSLSWPYTTYFDCYSRIIPKTVWGYVKEKIEGLGAIIV